MVPEPNSSPTANGSGERPSRSAAFPRHLGHVTDRVDDILPFVTVPFALSVLEVEQIERALDPTTASINLEFSLPSPLLTLWDLVDPPEPSGADTQHVGPGASNGGQPGATTTGTDVSIDMPLETFFPALESSLLTVIGIAILVYAVMAGLVTAGYLGGIDRRLRDEPAAIGRCLSQYGPRLVLYHLLVFGAFLAMFPFALALPGLILLAIPVVLVLGYLFYAVPFLIVVADVSLVDAFRRSAQFGLQERAYFWFAIGHALVCAIASIVLSLLVTVGAGVGVLLALVVGPAFALLVTAATVSFVQELARTGDAGRVVRQ
ncbi:hypothetical protein [Natrarchaeobaculum sulfurireducens]|nr:hypothetical protein [Natrarchaeobaculum sulfurireducens]